MLFFFKLSGFPFIFFGIINFFDLWTNIDLQWQKFFLKNICNKLDVKEFVFMKNYTFLLQKLSILIFL